MARTSLDCPALLIETPPGAEASDAGGTDETVAKGVDWLTVASMTRVRCQMIDDLCHDEEEARRLDAHPTARVLGEPQHHLIYRLSV